MYTLKSKLLVYITFLHRKKIYVLKCRNFISYKTNKYINSKDFFRLLMIYITGDVIPARAMPPRRRHISRMMKLCNIWYISRVNAICAFKKNLCASSRFVDISFFFLKKLDRDDNLFVSPTFHRFFPLFQNMHKM